MPHTSRLDNKPSGPGLHTIGHHALQQKNKNGKRNASAPKHPCSPAPGPCLGVPVPRTQACNLHEGSYALARHNLSSLMALFADLISEVQDHARSLQLFLAPAVQQSTPGYGTDYRRKTWLRHYEHADQPRYPTPMAVTPNTVLLLYMFVKTVRVQGLTNLASGTKVLLAASCLPFLKPGGFPSPKFGLSPFMVWEHRQWYRLLTTAFLHVDIDHARELKFVHRNSDDFITIL